MSQAVPECHQAGTGWVEHRILTCCFPLGAEGLGSTLWTSVFWGLLPSLYAEGIWGLATRGRAVCLCSAPFIHSVPASKLAYFHSLSFWQDFWQD